MRFLYKLTQDPVNGVCERDHLTCDVSEILIHRRNWSSKGKRIMLYLNRDALFKTCLEARFTKLKVSVTLFPC